MLHRLKPLITFMDDNRRFYPCFIAILLLLTLWAGYTTWLHGQSREAIVSAGRMLVEALAAGGMLLTLQYFKLEKWLVRGVIALSSINSLIGIIQLFEGIHCSPTNFSWMINEFWRLPVDEYSRKPGLFNGVLTSTLLAFVALSLLAGRKDRLGIVLLSLNVIPILFGARIFLVFLPLFLLIYWRAAIGAGLIIGMMALIGAHCGMLELMDSHIRHRYIPTINVIVDADLQKDYSTKDLATHYQEPADTREWLLGNGHPRFSSFGGRDPAISRWLLQAGMPSLLLIIFLYSMLCWRILRKGSWAQFLLGTALFLSIVKCDLVISTGIFTLLILYALTPAEQLTPKCSSKNSPA